MIISFPGVSWLQTTDRTASDQDMSAITSPEAVMREVCFCLFNQFLFFCIDFQMKIELKQTKQKTYALVLYSVCDNISCKIALQYASLIYLHIHIYTYICILA